LGNDNAVAPADAVVTAPVVPVVSPLPSGDLADVRGQADARWALEVAAAGGHHMLMVGPPGAGKTMLASRLPGILPDLHAEDAIAATSVHSLAGTLDAAQGLLSRPPFEAPHHSASAAAIVGGGSMLARPGAISRAHGGVLFLDEAPEFSVHVLQTLRQPLESGQIVLHRAHGAVRYPARFQLVLAANPCPCGRFYGPKGGCGCSALVRRRYFGRLSGPLLDRVDIQLDVHPVRRGAEPAGESSAVVAERVVRARERAAERLRELDILTNAQLPGTWLRANTPAPSMRPAYAAVDRGALTARGLDRVLRVAWTIADLNSLAVPGENEVLRAMALRSRGEGS
jgi:magnesium chelatase family protein